MLQVLEWLAQKAAWDALAFSVHARRCRRALASRGERCFSHRTRRLLRRAATGWKVAAFGVERASRAHDGGARTCATPLCGVNPSGGEGGDLGASFDDPSVSSHASRTPYTPRTPQAELAHVAAGICAPPPTPLLSQSALCSW